MASTTCPNCQTVTTAGTASCPGCGNALAGAPMSQTAATPPSSAGAAKPQIKFDLASVGRVDRLVGGGTLVLFIALFLPWYSVSLGPLGSVSFSGLTSHGYLYITLIVAIAIIGVIVAEVLGLWKFPATSPLTRDQFLLIGTAINFVLVLIAFLLKPGGDTHSGVGWSFGAFVGLAAAVIAVFPLGWPVIQARRGK
jgi:hypothetical protein